MRYALGVYLLCQDEYLDQMTVYGMNNQIKVLVLSWELGLLITIAFFSCLNELINVNIRPKKKNQC